MDAGLRLGTKNTFCAQSETSIRMSRGTGLLRVASQGFSQPFLKTLAAVYPDPTDRHCLQSNQQLGTNKRQNITKNKQNKTKTKTKKQYS